VPDPRITHSLRFAVLPVAGAALLALAACPPGSGERVDTSKRDTLSAALTKAAEHDTAAREQPVEAADTATIARLTDTTVTNARPGTLRIGSLDPLGDSISDRMVFLALTQTTYVAATRGKKLLIDLGRFDGTIAGAKQQRAFQAAAAALSPVHVGDRFRLRGPFGLDSAAVTGFALWNGRIVATLAVSHGVDSLARSRANLVALAQQVVPDTVITDSLAADSIRRADSTARADSLAQADSVRRADSIARAHARDTLAFDSMVAARTPPPCDRDSVSEALALRVAELADSLAHVLEADTLKLTDRLKKSLKSQRTQAVGCFAHWRVILLVSQQAGDYEYTHELGLVVDTAGVAMPLAVRDLRFKVHEVIEVFDADGDGVDDLVVRGRGNRIGGTVVLRFVPARRRLEYIMGGFAWEVF
jgi:hypothetical protein